MELAFFTGAGIVFGFLAYAVFAFDRRRSLHLYWNGTEWVDDRCGCAYHPDDPNNTHNGAPHVHPCAKHGPDHR